MSIFTIKYCVATYVYTEQLHNITIKPVYNNYPWCTEIVAVVHKWPLFRG